MKLLCLGDSLTEGYGINISKGWPNLIHLAYHIDVVNCGISGDTTFGMLSRCEKLLLEHEPTHLLILGGTNDLWFGLKDELITSNIYAMVAQARHHDIIPYVGVLTPSFNLNQINMVHENYSECIRSFRNNLINFCNNRELSIIDFSVGMQSNHFLEDRLHPNEFGQLVMMKNTMNIISKEI